MPRQVLPGSTYLVTRRCTQRQFFLKPSPLINSVIAFGLAYAAKKTGVILHAACAMSNHLHMVVTDPEARLPEFMHIVHLYIAKCLNASYGRWENLWASEPPSAVRLEGDEDILDKIAYTLANPTEAELVADGESWPGFRTSPDHVVGYRAVIQRPGVFFRPNSSVPEALELQTSRPAIFDHQDDVQFAELVRRAVETREAAARARVAAEGRSFAGEAAVAAQQPTDSPTTFEPRRQLSPRIAAKDKWRRIEALRRIRSFFEAYREAYQRFREHVRDVVFPAGTYAMRLRHGVLVEGAT